MIAVFGLRFGRYLLYELDLPPCGCSAVSEQVAPVTAFSQLGDNPFGIHSEDLERLARHGSTMFLYTEDGSSLGMMWGHRGSCYVRGPGLTLLQEVGRVYWFWIYTLPKARGKKVFQKLKDAFFDHYGSAGGYSALIEPDNIVMRNAAEKIGFAKKKMIYYIKWRGYTWVVEQSLVLGRFSFRLERGNSRNLVYI
jgi:GNAT superfamily N-acetyltransferase